MELHEQILCAAIARDVIPALHLDPEKLLEMRCYQAIQKIHGILSNDELSDKE